MNGWSLGRIRVSDRRAVLTGEDGVDRELTDEEMRDLINSLKREIAEKSYSRLTKPPTRPRPMAPSGRA